MGTPIIRKVLVSADALFDLRQGTLAFIDQDFAADIVSKPSYYLRDQDIFSSDSIHQVTMKPLGALDKEIYSKVFEQYKQEIIHLSLMTKILPFVVSLYHEYIRQALHTPFISGVEIDVNVWPFVFSIEEKKELLDSLNEHTANECVFNIIETSMEDLTPSYVKENYLAMVMYSYVEWFNHHNKAIQSNPLKEVGVYVPMLYHGAIPSSEDLLEFKIRNTTPFEFMTQALSPFIVIQFLPVSLFCVNIPANLKSYGTLVSET